MKRADQHREAVESAEQNRLIAAFPRRIYFFLWGLSLFVFWEMSLIAVARDSDGSAREAARAQRMAYAIGAVGTMLCALVIWRLCSASGRSWLFARGTEKDKTGLDAVKEEELSSRGLVHFAVWAVPGLSFLTAVILWISL
jgi:hypothetical protein